MCADARITVRGAEIDLGRVGPVKAGPAQSTASAEEGAQVAVVLLDVDLLLLLHAGHLLYLIP
ncbi:hypothetical protein [Frankia sp. CiP3]|uniref:hypothetical protein n=1 Tax=Frankia sp. CiP3 TaxID=2880971 RepID=UPI001EF40383|nr:hypothetical protein [Frankia sp. CiP3]